MLANIINIANFLILIEVDQKQFFYPKQKCTRTHNVIIYIYKNIIK